MSVGLGLDIVEIERVRAAIRRRPRLAARLFTERERSYAAAHRDDARRLAARFAAKEAVAKALGRSLSWHDVEVVNDAAGRPEAVLHGRARELAAGRRVLISLSHSQTHAAAVALIIETSVPRPAISLAGRDGGPP